MLAVILPKKTFCVHCWLFLKSTVCSEQFTLTEHFPHCLSSRTQSMAEVHADSSILLAMTFPASYVIIIPFYTTYPHPPIFSYISLSLSSFHRCHLRSWWTPRVSALLSEETPPSTGSRAGIYISWQSFPLHLL